MLTKKLNDLTSSIVGVVSKGESRMNQRLIGILVLILLSAANANAAELTIVGPANVPAGSSFDVQIFGDFTGEGLIAGGVTFFWDDALVQLDNVQLELAVVPDFSCPGAPPCPPDTANSTKVAWGDFLSDLIGPLDPAPTLMATLTFTAIGLGGVAAFSMESWPDFSGGWFGAGFVLIPTPTFGDFQTLIGVPVPAGSPRSLAVLLVMFLTILTAVAFDFRFRSSRPTA